MKPFLPLKFPIKSINWEKLSPLIGEANTEIGRYDGLLAWMPNPEILLAPLTRKEAELSSKIEGTQSTMSEVLEFEAGLFNSDDFKKQEINVLRNYKWALNAGEEALKNGRPLSLSLIKEIHSMLMHNSRWDSSETPGQFRKKQVYIGAKGAGIENASYVPPEHFLIEDYMENWQKYLLTSPEDKLVKTAFMHAQFEIIHPFDDGNGRIGRMLIPLFLSFCGVLERPMFYMSEYLEENRQQYYQSLSLISQNGDWQQWIEFFLTALKQQTKKNISKAKDIQNLYNSFCEKFQKSTKSQYHKAALDVFFRRPITNSVFFAEKTGINANTARNLLKKLEKDLLIKKIQEGKGPNPSIYVFTDLLNLVEDKKLF